MELHLDSDGVRLRAALADPAHTATPSAGLVLCHGLVPGEGGGVDTSFDELAAALSSATGWTVLSFNLRQAGDAQLPVAQWLVDMRTAIAHVREIAGNVWLAGFSMGGAVAIAAAGNDEEVRGVASFGAPADVDSLVQPLQSISKVPPRPVLLVHGDSDDVVSVSDARALADAAGGEVELRVLAGAGHGLRHDPRATAVLEGWLDRQTS